MISIEGFSSSFEGSGLSIYSLVIHNATFSTPCLSILNLGVYTGECSSDSFCADMDEGSSRNEALYARIQQLEQGLLITFNFGCCFYIFE